MVGIVVSGGGYIWVRNPFEKVAAALERKKGVLYFTTALLSLSSEI